MIGARSEELAKEAFSRMHVRLDLNMTMIRPLNGVRHVEYLKDFGDIYKRPEKRLEPLLVSQEQWKRDKIYLWHEDRIVVPSDRMPALLKWTHESSGHVGARSQSLGHSQKKKNNRVATAKKLSVACPKPPSKVRALGARDLCAPQNKIHTNNNNATGHQKTSMLYAAQR